MSKANPEGVKKLRATRRENNLCIDCGIPTTGTVRCPKHATISGQARNKAAAKLRVLKTPQLTEYSYNQIKKEWAFPLDWEAAQEYILSHQDLWIENRDRNLWDPLPLQYDREAQKEPTWIPAHPYYSRLGSLISFEDYMIEHIDFQLLKELAFC